MPPCHHRVPDVSNERLLLLTSHPPGGHGVGQIYLRSLCDLFSPRSVAVAALLSGSERWMPPVGLELLSQTRLDRRYEAVYRPFRGIIGEAVAVAGVQIYLQPQARRLAAAAADAGRTAGVGAVAAVLDGPSTMLMAERLADTLNVPLYTLVWDTPEHVLSGFGHTGWSARPLQRGFDAALRRSTGVAVMSDAMQRRFASDYGARCTILRQPIEGEWKIGRCTAPHHSADDFIIGFAGSITARDELELLCRALDSVQWTLAGRPVRLRIYGLRYVCQAQTARWIDYRGYVPETADVVAGLSECDVLFLPQPFRAQGRPFAEFSFPTKFTTYLAAGRPLLVLAPPYSALTKFCREHDLPVVCDQLQESAVLDHLRRLSADPDRAAELELRLQTVAADEFNPQVARDRLGTWLSPKQVEPDHSGDGPRPVFVNSQTMANDRL